MFSRQCGLWPRVLDKGKPVVRPGRKAKGRRRAGRPAAERITRIDGFGRREATESGFAQSIRKRLPDVSASDEEEAFN